MTNEHATEQLTQTRSLLLTLSGPEGIDSLETNEVVDVITVAVGLLTSAMAD